MYLRIQWLGVITLALVGATVNAQEPRDAGSPAPAVSEQDPRQFVETLSGQLKARLTQGLPPQLVIEKDNNWGHQAQVPSIQGLTPITVLRNHGRWEKSKVVSGNLPKRLRVDVVRVNSTAENRVTFAVHVALPADLELRQQIWQNGVQVYTSHLRSRFQLSAVLEMEAETLPAADAENGVRLKLVRGTYSCDHFVAENVNGLGGDFARWLDNGSGHSFKPWQPAILNEFQDKIAHVLGTAGDEREVRSCLSKLVRHANSVRSAYVAPEPTEPLPAAEPSAPRCVPLFFNASFEFDISRAGRVGTPSVERLLLHPALTNFAIHVAHAALEAATHIHPEPERKR